MSDLQLPILEADSDSGVGILNPPPAALSASKPTLLHSGMGVTRVYGLHLISVIFPFSVGLSLFGWRAILVVLLVCLATVAGIVIWRRIGRRGAQLSIIHGLWMASLLAMMLPAHLATARPIGDSPPHLWAILIATGLALAILCWLLGGVGSGRIHPVLVTYLLLVIFFEQTLVPTGILQRNHLVTGDVTDTLPARTVSTGNDPWYAAPLASSHPAIEVDPASHRLWLFTTGTLQPDRSWLSLEGLLRDRMPPLEDLIVAGQPGPIGAASAVGVLIGGLFLLYRGLIDYRIPVLIVLSAGLAFLILPMPVVIREDAPQWRWMVVRDSAVDMATVLTFVNYELLSSPLLFMAFYLATAPAVRPMTRRGRTIYAILVGIGTAVAQLYASVSFGPYLGLLMVSLITPSMDKWFCAKPLV